MLQFWLSPELLAKYRCFGSVCLPEPVLVFEDQGMRLDNQLSCKKKREAAQQLNVNYSVQPSHQLARILSLSFAIYIVLLSAAQRLVFPLHISHQSLSVCSVLGDTEQVPYLRFREQRKDWVKANVWQRFSEPTSWPDVWMLKTKEVFVGRPQRQRVQPQVEAYAV